MSLLKLEHDLEGTVEKYQHGAFGRERGDLFSMLSQEIHASRTAKRLLAEIAEEAYRQGLGPVDVLALGLNYGLVLGILMERERRDRRLV